jgi:formylglycine-generating enzyme required for sulfatase activity
MARYVSDQMNGYRLTIQDKDGNDTGEQGTAWFLRPDLVLTAFHVVGNQALREWFQAAPEREEDTFWLIGLPGDGKVRLNPGCFDATADVALLTCPPVNGIRRLTLASAAARGTTWWADGFPGFARGKVWALTGSISADRGDRLQLLVDQGTQVPWGGMSGSAVCIGEGVVAGLITDEEPGATTLQATSFRAIARLVDVFDAVRENLEALKESGIDWKRDIQDLHEQIRHMVEVPEQIAALQARLEKVQNPKIETMPVGDGAGPLAAYRQRLIRELANNPRYQLDRRFVRLSLLLTRDPNASAAETRDYDDLRVLLRGNKDDRAFVLLGAPGAGKSTLLRHLQLLDAGDDTGGSVSFLISLNAYARDKPPKPAEWLAQEWEALATGLPAFDVLSRNGRLLLLLDALNELRHDDRADLQSRIAAWRDFLPGFVQAGNTVVLTCRRLDYTTLSSKGRLDVRRVTVKPLAPEQIHDFLQAYAPDRAEIAWTQLKDDDKQLELLGTPYFLRLLVDQIKPDGSMPCGRAGLFTGFVRASLKRELEADNRLFMLDALLGEEDRRRLSRDDEDTWSSPHDLPEEGCLIGKLSEFAFSLQRAGARGEGRQVSIAKAEASKMLDHPFYREILDAAEQLNILNEAGTSILFYHQLLQEYFAARQFAGQLDLAQVRSEWRVDRIQPDLRETMATLSDHGLLPPPPATGWEETALMAAAMYYRHQGPGQGAYADDFIRQLAQANLPLAGRCAAAPDARISSVLKAELQQRLRERLTDAGADLRARIEAGLRLGDLGDPRFERREGPHGPYLVPPLVPIPAGEYLVGDDKSDKEDEKPLHTVRLAAYEIGMYPVTNAEFRMFVSAGGYEQEKWWDTPAAKAWQRGETSAKGQRESWRDWRDNPKGVSEKVILGTVREGRDTSQRADHWSVIRNWSNEEFEAWLDEKFPEGEVYRRPRFWDDPNFNNSSQPVVGICWHEARAYCAWLSAQTGASFRLPTEAEWEASARGPSSPSSGGRVYAYGGTFDAARCNTFETHVGRTTPVGLFVEGKTPEGVADLCGNVWDWTSSAFLAYPYEPTKDREHPAIEAKYRVARGGSWYLDQNFARVSYRVYRHPDHRVNVIGFRVVRESAGSWAGSR